MIDYESETQSGPNQDQLAVISGLAQQQLKLERDLAKLEQEMKDKAKALRKIQEQDLPDAMLAAGCKGYTLSTGEGITIKEDISASLSEGKKGPAIAWLKEHGFGDIVSDDVAVSFGKGKEDEARETVDLLKAHGLIPVLKTNVNTATLKSLIRELLEKGEEVDLELLGAYQWRKAIIK